MLSHLLVVGVAFIVSFILTSFLYPFLLRYEFLRKTNLISLISVVFGSIVPSSVILLFYWNKFDFVSDISSWTFLAPLIGLAVVFATCFVDRVHAVTIGVFLATIIGVFGGGLFVDVIPDYPIYVNKICSVLMWFLFSIGIRSAARIYPVLQIQSITISAGFVLLFIFGASPFMVAVVAATLLASSSVAYLNCANQYFGTNVSPVIGYIIGWFGLISYNEMLMPCFVILVMFCLIEIGISLARRLTFLQKYKNFEENSFIVQICKSELDPKIILKSLWMLSAIVLVFCVFQANGVNSYSIPAFVGIITIWYIYKMINWKEEKSWKEINREAVNEIKETITTVVKEIKKNKKVKNNSVSKPKKAPKTKKVSKPDASTKVKNNSKAKKGKK